MVRSNAIVVVIVLVVVVLVVVITAEEGTVGQLVASVVPAVTVAVSSSVSFSSPQVTALGSNGSHRGCRVIVVAVGVAG